MANAPDRFPFATGPAETLKRDFGQLEYKVAETFEEFEGAARLVYREYSKRGYAKPNPNSLKLILWQALPQTTTFIVNTHGEVVATLSLIPDSPLALPIELTYSREIAHLRTQGRRLAEVGLLALDTDRFGHGIFSMTHPRKLFFLFRLFKLMHDHARFVDRAEDLVIAFNPKHQLLYRFLCFEPLGEVSHYEGDPHRPAVAMRLNLRTAEEKYRRIASRHHFFFGKPTPMTKFANRLRLEPEGLKRLFVLQTPLFSHASPQQLEYIKSCYPGYDFRLILNGHQAGA